MAIKEQKKVLLGLYGEGGSGNADFANMTEEEKMQVRKDLGLYYSDIKQAKGNRLYIDMMNLVEIPMSGGGDSPVYSINPDLKGEPTRDGNDYVTCIFSYIPMQLPEEMVHYSNENNGGGEEAEYSVNPLAKGLTKDGEEEVFVDRTYAYFNWVRGTSGEGSDYLVTDSASLPLHPNSYNGYPFFYVHTEGDYDFAGGSSPVRGETSETAIHLKPGFYLRVTNSDGQREICTALGLSDSDNYYDQDNNDTGKSSYEYFGDIFPVQSNVITEDLIYEIFNSITDESDPRIYMINNEYLLQLYQGQLKDIVLPASGEDDPKSAPTPVPFSAGAFTAEYTDDNNYGIRTGITEIVKNGDVSCYWLDSGGDICYLSEDYTIPDEPDIQESVNSTRAKKSGGSKFDLSKFKKNVSGINDTTIPAGVYLIVNDGFYNDFALSIHTSSKIVDATTEVVKGQVDCKYIPDKCKGGSNGSTRVWYIEQDENGCTEYMDNWYDKGGNVIPTSEIEEVCDKALNGEIPNIVIYMKCKDDQWLDYRSDNGKTAVYFLAPSYCAFYVLRYVGIISDGNYSYIQFKASASNAFSDSQGFGSGEFVIYAAIKEDGTYETCNSTSKILNVYSYVQNQS